MGCSFVDFMFPCVSWFIFEGEKLWEKRYYLPDIPAAEKAR